MSALLEAASLSKTFFSEHNALPAVCNVSFSVAPGECLGLAGASGCGKSTLGRTLIRLLEPTSGKITLFDQDITHLSKKEMLPFRRDVQIVFQDPYTSLNPRQRVGDMLMEVLAIHHIGDKNERMARALDIMAQVGLRPEHFYRYPHEFSGGMRQRVMIAMALACQPQILIADEPTTALDVTIQAQILDLIRDLNQEMNTSVVFITHDLGVVSELCDTVIVMYNGHIVEKAPTADIFREPLHPYTQGLLSAIPRITKERKPLSTIEGMVPNPVERIKGCRFWPRCPKACDRCRKEEPPVFSVGEDRQVRCWLYAQADNGSQEAVTNG